MLTLPSPGIVIDIFDTRLIRFVLVRITMTSYSRNLKPYYWRPVDRGEIRLITLMPGLPQSPIRISIHHVRPEQPTAHVPEQRLSLDKLQETLPDDWIVAKTHQYQYRFLFEDPDENTSWDHPNPDLDPSLWAPCPEIPPQSYQPDYEALSYVCGLTGDGHPSEEIVVTEDGGDAKIMVGHNLASALQDLRCEEKTRTLWIDAISINQEDPIERAHQVKNISQVYRWARRVVIWLSAETETSALAISTLEHIGKQLEVSSDHRRYRSPTATKKDWFRSICTLDFPNLTWRAIDELFQREWWERLWVWQESQLANSRAVVLAGRENMLWQDLRKAIICLRTKDILSSSCPDLRERLQMIETMTLERSSVSLNLVLNATRIRKCLEPKDKIYGILSIAGEMISRQITPDYTERTNAGDVYREVVELYTLQTHRLDLLASCEYSDTKITENLPSWVPDMNSARQTETLLPFQLVSGVSGAEATFTGDHLRAAGLGVGVVDIVHDPFSHDNERAFQDLRDLYSTWNMDRYGTPIDRDTYMRTVRVGYFDEGWSGFAAPTFASWKSDFVAAVLHDKRPQHADFAWCLRLVKGRSIFRTHDGRVGLGPSQARKGMFACTQ